MIDSTLITASLPAVLSSLKEAFGIAKSIKDFSNDAKLEGALSELRSRLIDAQKSVLDAQAQMQEIYAHTSKVEGQLAEYRNWEKEAAKYKLAEPFPGTFVYAFTEGELGIKEPMHYLCPKCFNQRQKSILQDGGLHGFARKCNECDISYRFKLPPESEPRRNTY